MVYLDMLSTKVKPWIDSLHWTPSYVFQQDGAPTHMAKKSPLAPLLVPEQFWRISGPLLPQISTLWTLLFSPFWRGKLGQSLTAMLLLSNVHSRLHGLTSTKKLFVPAAQLFKNIWRLYFRLRAVMLYKTLFFFSIKWRICSYVTIFLSSGLFMAFQTWCLTVLKHTGHPVYRGSGDCKDVINCVFPGTISRLQPSV